MSNIQDIRSIDTPQKSYMWEVDIAGLPSGSLSSLTFYAKTVTIPQNAVEQIKINHKSSSTHYAGRDSSGKTATITFWDDEAGTISKFFYNWQQLIRNNETGAQNPRSVYAAETLIKLKDSSDEVVTSTIKLTKSWVSDVSDISLSYDSSEPVEISVTLAFDERVID